MEDLYQEAPFQTSDFIERLKFRPQSSTFSRLSISSVNQAKMSFIKIDGEKFYPQFSTCYFANWAHTMQDQEPGMFVTHEEMYYSEARQLLPYQMMFRAKSRRAQDVWSLLLSFWLPDRVNKILSAFEIYDVLRINSTPYVEPTPKIKLIEYRIESNELKFEKLIDESLPTVNTAFKRFVF